MPLEIERKFLLAHEGWKGLAEGVRIVQGYLSLEKNCSVRVRLAESRDGARAWLGLKGKSQGMSRLEFEYAVPPEEALVMLENLAGRPLIEKTRHAIPFGGLIWEVDEFFGDNQGLVIAEVELESEGQGIVLPDWIGREVTGDPRYYNASLVKHPFKNW